ncbi:laccase-2-like [Gossypium australe]|uniref:Laccase-2-like n=1 Tax=Gossypium australe TaxID=47621 RepID=A0A5B6WU49_9ROSI|nr:laccase-2-like [Gossypium australe]
MNLVSLLTGLLMLKPHLTRGSAWRNVNQSEFLLHLEKKLSSSEYFQKVDGTNYQSLVGCLLYLTATQPDIMFTVGLLSKFMRYCDTSHFKDVKRVLRYVRGTTDFGVWYAKANTLKLVSYTDNNWAGLMDDMRNTFGYFFLLGSGSSNKQSIVAQSTTEAEYVAAAAAVNQAIWLRKLLFDLNIMYVEATQVLYDNQSTIAIAKNSIFHRKTKHFKIKKEVTLVHYSTKTQLVDILTKPLGKTRFEKLRNKIGVRNIKANEEFCKITNHTTCTFGEPSKIGELTVSGELP